MRAEGTGRGANRRRFFSPRRWRSGGDLARVSTHVRVVESNKETLMEKPFSSLEQTRAFCVHDGSVLPSMHGRSAL